MTFGEKIKSARVVCGLTQKELAEKIGSKHNSISNWENDQNKPDPDTIGLLCGVLGISPSYLLSDAEQMRNFSDPQEMIILNKYHNLDAHGKKIVKAVLEIEYNRCLSHPASEVPMVAEATPLYMDKPHLMPIAAHDDGSNPEDLQQDLDEL